MTEAARAVHHPQPRDYVRIAAVLAVLTGFEVGLFYLEASTGDNVPGWLFPVGLLLLSAIKFFLVVAYFMHLRYEKRLLSRFFSIGAVLAVSLYVIVLAILGAITLSG